MRGASRLSHFTIDAIRDPAVLAMVERVRTVADPAMDARGHSSVDVAIDMTDGRRFALALDVAPGFPGNGLTDAEHFQRFDDCMAYAPRALAADRARAWLDAIDSLEDIDDVRQLLPLLVVDAG
ncbi:MAG: hypothetical protein R3E48_17865 [Burkholderiaceae bacterium]